MRKNYRKTIVRQNIRYYYFLSFIFFGYILSIISIYFYPAVIKSLGGIFVIGLFSLGITIFIFNFTGFKGLIDKEIDEDMEEYEKKHNKAESNK